MRISYSITADPRQEIDARILTHLTAASRSIIYPYARDPDIFGKEEDGIDLGTVTYPSLYGTKALLPPLLLLDPLDDPVTAEERYHQYQGYRFFGQMILPSNNLGEQVFVTITREALSIWQQRLPICLMQQQALLKRGRDLSELYQNAGRVSPTIQQPLSPEEKVLIQGVGEDLHQPNVDLRVAALEKLTIMDGSRLPVEILFPCLNDDRPEVRLLAITLLCKAGPRLPVKLLEDILDQADLRARLDAITLLGKTRGSDAASSLLMVLIEQPHRWLRLATLSSIRDIYWDDLDEMDFVDVIGEVYMISQRDSDSEVREAALDVLETLGGTGAVKRALGNHLSSFQDPYARSLSTSGIVERLPGTQASTIGIEGNKHA